MSEKEIYNNRQNDKHLSQIEDKIDKIYKKLFEDNGKPCIQTMLERHEMRLCNCEKEMACHLKDHIEASLLIKKPLISVIIASSVGAIISFFSFTKLR